MFSHPHEDLNMLKSLKEGELFKRVLDKRNTSGGQHRNASYCKKRRRRRKTVQFAGQGAFILKSENRLFLPADGN